MDFYAPLNQHPSQPNTLPLPFTPSHFCPSILPSIPQCTRNALTDYTLLMSSITSLYPFPVIFSTHTSSSSFSTSISIYSTHTHPTTSFFPSFSPDVLADNSSNLPITPSTLTSWLFIPSDETDKLPKDFSLISPNPESLHQLRYLEEYSINAFSQSIGSSSEEIWTELNKQKSLTPPPP